MKRTKRLVFTLCLAGCAAPAVTINLPPDHPASPAGPEAAYDPTPAPIAGASETPEEVAGMGGGGKSAGGGAATHHHHGGGGR